MPKQVLSVHATTRVLRSPALWRMYFQGERHELIAALKTAVEVAPPQAVWTQLLSKLYDAARLGTDPKVIDQQRMRLYEMLTR